MFWHLVCPLSTRRLALLFTLTMDKKMGTTGQESSATTLRKTLPWSLLLPQGTGTKNAEAPQTTGAALSGQGQKQSKTKHKITCQECHRAWCFLFITWATGPWENRASCSPWSPEDGVPQISSGYLPEALLWGVISGHNQCSWQGWGLTHSAHDHLSTRGQSLREEGIWRKQIQEHSK